MKTSKCKGKALVRAPRVMHDPLTTSYVFEVKKNPQIILSGEYNIVDSVFQGLAATQLKYILNPALLYLMVIYQLSINKLFVFYMLYCLFMAVLNFYFIGRNKELSISLKRTFYINMFKYLSLSVSMLFIWIYYCGYLHYSILFVILLGNICVMAFRLFLASLPRTYVDGQFGDLMESVQYLFIALKITGFITFSWEWVLIFYVIFTYLVTFTGFVGMFFLPIMLGMSTFHPPDSDDRKTLLFSSWIFYHISWKGIWFYYLYHNFLIFAKKNELQPGMSFFVTDPTLLPLFIIVCAGGFINMYWFLQQKPLLSRIIALKLMIIITTKGVRREIIEVPFDMKIVQAGTNYFKKLISDRKIPQTFEIPDSVPKGEEEISECMICCTNQSNVLIRPCNHGGICESCIITYLGTNNACPNCKAKIDKIYVMDYNKDVKKFYGTKVLTLV